MPAEPSAGAAGSVLDDLVHSVGVDDAASGRLRRAAEALFTAALDRELPAQALTDPAIIDAMIADLDERIGRQVDEVLHDPAVQRCEAAWRGLRFLVDRTDFGQNIRIDVLDVGKAQLLADFEDTPDLVQSGLYRLVYTNEYGTFGGQPFGAIIADYAFANTPQDLLLLRRIAAVSANAHAPFIAAAAPQFFGLRANTELAHLGSIDDLFAAQQYAKWRAFRGTEDARYVGLTTPRFLLREPHSGATGLRSFAYQERIGTHEHLTWGNAAFAFATRLVDSFARWRWCTNIVGPTGGGIVPGLVRPAFAGTAPFESRIPTEVMLPERCDYGLSEHGFIPLVALPGNGQAGFFSANSCQAARTFGNSAAGREASLGHRLGTQLPYMFIINRLAHYLKVMQREQIGTGKTRTDIEAELGRWISQYVVDMENPDAATRRTNPLRMAQVKVEENPGNAGWYTVHLQIRPHFKYMGAAFTLTLVGKLDIVNP